MKIEKINNREYKILEVEDVLKMKPVDGNDITVENWPYGRKTCSMHFYIESGKDKERFCKQSTFEGKLNKPKKATYADRVLIVTLDNEKGRPYTIGRIEIAQFFSMIKVIMENTTFHEATFFDPEAKVIYDKFFKDKYYGTYE
jgi:hypothetical protein